MASIQRTRSITPITPSVVIGDRPCLECVSEKELLAILLYLLAQDAGLTVAETLEQSSCFRCLSDKQMLQGLVALYADAYLENDSMANLMAQVKCLQCAPRKQIFAALLYTYGTILDVAET